MIILDSGRVIDPANRIDGTRTVLIDGDHIREVREQPATPAEKLVHQVIDCRGRWVLPGLVDLHVHLREPGNEEDETIATGAISTLLKGIDWEWQSLDGAMNKSPLGGEKNREKPDGSWQTRRQALGVDRWPWRTDRRGGGWRQCA